MNVAFGVILIDSTSQAMRIEKLLTRCEITCKLIPVPRQLSSDCGVCVRILKADMANVKTLLHAHHIEIQAMEEI